MITYMTGPAEQLLPSCLTGLGLDLYHRHGDVQYKTYH